MSFCFIAHFTLINVLTFYRMFSWVELDSFMLYQLFPLENFIFTPLRVQNMYAKLSTQAIHFRHYSPQNLILKCINIRENSFLNVCR